jgi:pantoate--beta-alanine ligase
MGWLHDGHRALMRAARAETATSVVTIFVNPRQFQEAADYTQYPRDEPRDLTICSEEGVDLVFAPGIEEVYPPGFDTRVTVGAIAAPLEGAARPGHFDGVATVVAKLLGQVRPDLALFGEKDYQQLAVIRRMAADLDLGVEIIGVPTVREPDGLALSSRNAYLSEAERNAARALPEALGAAAAAIAAGAPVAPALNQARARLAAAGFDPIDYVELRAADNLESLSRLDRPARLLAAARLGRTRLIDNVPVDPV